MGGGGPRRADWLTEGYRLARQTRVSVCQALLAIEPLIVPAEEDILRVMRRAAAQPATRLIGVIGDDGRLVGIVPLLRVAEAVVGRVVPESLLAAISDVADVAEFGHIVQARSIGELMLEPASVQEDATIGDAFRVMRQRHLSGLYVVDTTSRPTGYLDLLELSVRYLDALELEDHPDQAARRAAFSSRDDADR